MADLSSSAVKVPENPQPHPPPGTVPVTTVTVVSPWRWIVGMVYVVAVAVIWIAASFVVQSVVNEGVAPFLITYICNSLFVIYIPIVEGQRALKRILQERGWGWGKRSFYGKLVDGGEKIFHTSETQFGSAQSSSSRNEISLENVDPEAEAEAEVHGSGSGIRETSRDPKIQGPEEAAGGGRPLEREQQEGNEGLLGLRRSSQDDGDDNEPWPRTRIAAIGLTICPFWFLAQFTFNLSLKYTTVTSNTILSTTSSLFTFLVSWRYLGERFTWIKMGSVALCMAGTIIVALGDSWQSEEEGGGVKRRPNENFFGDIICLASAMFYAGYTAIIRAKIPDEDDAKGKVSTALIFGYLGLFNALFFGPIALILHFTRVEPFHRLTSTQVGLIIAKGLLDNVLSDYLWARAVLLTTPTVATAGLTIQVPIAAVVDSLRGRVPSLADIFGAVAVLVGFFGINKADPPLPLSPPTEGEEEKDLLATI